MASAHGAPDTWPGRWVSRDEPLPADAQGNPRQGRRSVWLYERQKVTVTQTVELVASEQSGPNDTCLVRYRLANDAVRFAASTRSDVHAVMHGLPMPRATTAAWLLLTRIGVSRLENTTKFLSSSSVASTSKL